MRLGLGRGHNCGQALDEWAEPDPLALQVSRAHCASTTWMTALQTHATMDAAWMALPVSHVPVPQGTQARAARVRWMNAAANLAAMGANA